MAHGDSAIATGHVPVLLNEAIAGLQIRDDGSYLDATFGRGGHANAMLERLGPGGRLVLMDRDPAAICVATAKFASEPRVSVVHAPFSALQAPAAGPGYDGILFDFGVSSPQLDEPGRGFSFQVDGPLDMRMDPTQGQPASSFLAQASATDIADVLYRLGEERRSRAIAAAIVEQRALQPLTTTLQLAELVARIVPRERGPRPKHPATRTFQALRIHVNDELGEIERGLDAALQALAPGGRLAVISFHSLEDRLAKRFIARHSQPPRGDRRLPPPQALTPLPLRSIGGAARASAAEVARNPRARSAVLRVAERCQ